MYNKFVGGIFFEQEKFRLIIFSYLISWIVNGLDLGSIKFEMTVSKFLLIKDEIYNVL
jgi:hypothetical protein